MTTLRFRKSTRHADLLQPPGRLTGALILQFRRRAVPAVCRLPTQSRSRVSPLPVARQRFLGRKAVKVLAREAEGVSNLRMETSGRA